MIPFPFLRQCSGQTLGKGFLVLLLSIILGNNPVGAMSPTAAPTTPITLQLSEGKLTAQFTAASLHQVMDEIERLSGARVVWLTPEGDRQVSATFTALPLHDALQRLLGTQGFLLLYTSTADTARLSQIWISAANHNAEHSFVSFAPTMSIPRTTPDTEPTSQSAGKLNIRQTQLRNTLIEQALNAPEPEARLEALHKLTVRQDKDPHTQDALATVAAKTDDPTVLEAAEAALAED